MTNHHLRKCIVAAAAIGLGATLSATATAEDTDAAPDAQQLAATEFEPITVSAGRREQLQSESPAPISVLDRFNIDQRQASSPVDILRDMPGVTTQDGPRRDAYLPMIRGLSEGRVVIRIDGARQNLHIRHRGQSFIDPHVLQQVEVLRGPASTLFGSGAIGGVVDFRTLSPDSMLAPDQNFGGRIAGGYQSNGDQTLGSLTLAGRTGDFGFLANGSIINADDYEDGDGNAIDFSEADVRTGLFKTTWQPSDNDLLTLTYLDYEDDSLSFSTADRPRGDTVNRVINQRTASLRWEHKPRMNDLLNADVTIYNTDLQMDETRLDNSSLTESTLKTTGIDAFNTSIVNLGGMEHILTYGLEYYVDEQVGRENGILRMNFTDAEQTTFGVFLQDRIGLTDRLALTLGARYDNIQQEADDPVRQEELRDVKFTEVSPQATLSFAVTDELNVYASYAEAFRAPALRELYVGGEHFPGNEYMPNQDLTPESAANKEIGLYFTRRGIMNGGDRLLAQVSIYQNDVDDFIEQVVRGDTHPEFPNTTQFLNVANARIRGGEFEVRYDHPGFYTGVIASAMRGDDTNANVPLWSIPAHQVTLLGAIRLQNPRMEIGSRVVLTDSQDRIPPTTDPDAPGATGPWHELDLFMTWWATDELRMDLRVDNVLDTTYRSSTNLVNSPGTNARVQLAYHF